MLILISTRAFPLQDYCYNKDAFSRSRQNNCGLITSISFNHRKYFTVFFRYVFKEKDRTTFFLNRVTNKQLSYTESSRQLAVKE